LLNLSLIRRQKPDPIAIHFNSTEHSVNDYEIVALEKNYGDNFYRETIEKLRPRCICILKSQMNKHCT
jgi:hypothetical protein